MMLWSDLGRVEYRPTVFHLHRLLVEARREKRLAQDVVLFQEFEPVITVGSRGGEENLLLDREQLQEKGIEVVRADRGGNATYHGPGQLVVCPIMDLASRQLGLHAYIAWLEEIVIRTLREWGVAARRHPEYTGVWCAGGKIAAIGVGARRRIVFHGVSLNVNPRLEHFAYLVPCGLSDEEVTSLARERGGAPALAEVRDCMLARWETGMQESLEYAEPGALEKLAGGA